MPTEEKIHFTFISEAQPEDTFTAIEFKGTEGISNLYQFEIIVYAEDPDLDLKQILKSPAKITLERDGEKLRHFHGILARLEQLHERSGQSFYKAILVPRLWLADRFHENQLFLDKSIPDILEEILKQTGLTSNDYELKLTGSYNPWEYICQYNETDFSFISRWMEREGIYYYFEQSDQSEKLILTDRSTAHLDIASGKSIRYSPPDSLTPSTTEQIREFTCHQQILPKKVILKDYNYRKPSLDLKGEADVDPEGRGNVYLYGEHFKTPEEGNALAKIRAEELLCREAVFYGEGTVPYFLTGYIFEMHDHYRESYNQRYLITELRHQGVQSTHVTGSGGHDSDKTEEKPSYFNNFTAIQSDIQFRPLRRAEKPKIDGTINAKVDAAGNGEYAEIDDEGRYKVKLPLDQSGNGDGKASRWIRMAQPYAGADYGMHFPLHKGTEVLLTFIDGDPDRPIISGTVPNPETGSPITSETQTKCMIRSGGGNQIHMEDQDGKQLINLYSPTAKSHMRIGAPNPSTGENGIDIYTEHHMDTIVLGKESKSIGANTLNFGSEAQWQHIEGDRKLEVTGKETIDITGDRNKHVHAKEKMFIDARQEAYIQGGRVMQVSSGGDTSVIYDGQHHTVHGNREATVNGNSTTTINGAETHTATSGRTITVHGVQTRNIDSENSIYKAAQSSITSGDYKSIYSGMYYDQKLAASIENYIGAKLQLNASVGVELSGVKIGSTDVNIGLDILELKDGKLVLGRGGTLIDNRIMRLFS